MAVQEVLERHVEKSAILSKQQMPFVIPVADVVRVLNKARISFVIVGAHGLAGWRKKPRATEDVDVVVAARQVKKAVRVLLAAFPHLEPVELPVVVRLRERETGDVAIDVMKPVQQPYVEVFRHTHKITTEGQTYRVPSLEMGLVMKFSSMTSLYRADADKYLDAHDFITMVRENADLDTRKLSELASLMYPDGGKNILEMLRSARAGEKLIL